MNLLIPLIGLLSALTLVLSLGGLFFPKIRKPSRALAVASFVLFVACLLFDPRILKSGKASGPTVPEQPQTSNKETRRGNETEVVSPLASANQRNAVTELNPSWCKRACPDFSKYVLSDSGYPVIGVVKTWVVCVSAFQVQEANDAMKAGRTEWANSIPGCLVLAVGTEGEWTKERVLDDIGEFRFEVTGTTRPITMYGPSRAMAGVAWYGLLVRQEVSRSN